MGDGEATVTIFIKDDGGPPPGPSYVASSTTGYSTPSAGPAAVQRASTGNVTRATAATQQRVVNASFTKAEQDAADGEETRQAQKQVIQQRVAARFAQGEMTGDEEDRYEGQATRQAQQRVIHQRVADATAQGPMDAKEQAEFEGQLVRSAQENIIRRRVASAFSQGPMDAKEKAEFEAGLTRAAQENVLRRRIAARTAEKPMSKAEGQAIEDDAVKEHRFQQRVVPLAKMSTGIGASVAAGGYFAAGKPIQGAIATYAAAKTLKSGIVGTAKAAGLSGATAVRLGALAGPIGVFAAGIGAAGVAVKKFTDVMSAEVQKASMYSGHAAMALARSDIKRELANIRSSRRLGKKLASFENVRSDYEIAMQELWVEVKVLLLDFFEYSKPILDGALTALKAISWLLGQANDNAKDNAYRTSMFEKALTEKEKAALDALLGIERNTAKEEKEENDPFWDLFAQQPFTMSLAPAVTFEGA